MERIEIISIIESNLPDFDLSTLDGYTLSVDPDTSNIIAEKDGRKGHIIQPKGPVENPICYEVLTVNGLVYGGEYPDED